MTNGYSTTIVKRLTGATENQLKYWVKSRIVVPERIGKVHRYSFGDIVKLRVLVQLRKNGLSLQKVRKGIANLSRILPCTDDSICRLIIHTDGYDMIVVEKGTYFNAITRQQYFAFDTEKIEAEIVRIEKDGCGFTKNENIDRREREPREVC